MRTKVRKLTSILLAAIMAFGIFTIVPITASAAASGDFEYEILDDGTAEITAYNGSAETLTIPSELDGYTVTSIGYRSFYGNKTLTSLIIPDSVKNIGNMVFSSCNLTSVTLGNGVTSIGVQAFMSNQSLTSIEFGNSLTTISDRAFVMCKSLTDITIPEGVTRIGISAFQNCQSLASVTIPDSVTSIGGSAFSNTKLYTDQPDGVFYVDGWACAYKGTMPANTAIEIKDGTRGLADKALYYNANLVSVTIPDSVKYVGEGQFTKCTGLTSAKIGNGVTSIRKETFSECTSLESIIIPKSVTNIDTSAFNSHSDTLTIYGYEGSQAEAFANEKGINFSILSDEPTPILGDVDGDKELTVLDATEIQKYIAMLTTFTDTQKAVADVDGNGSVDIYDVTRLQQYIAKLIPALR